MTVKTEGIAWVLAFIFAMAALMFGVANSVDSINVKCSCTECVYSAGIRFSLTVPIDDERVKVSGTFPITLTCDKTGQE